MSKLPDVFNTYAFERKLDAHGALLFEPVLRLLFDPPSDAIDRPASDWRYPAHWPTERRLEFGPPYQDVICYARSDMGMEVRTDWWTPRKTRDGDALSVYEYSPGAFHFTFGTDYGVCGIHSRPYLEWNDKKKYLQWQGVTGSGHAYSAAMLPQGWREDEDDCYLRDADFFLRNVARLQLYKLQVADRFLEDAPRFWALYRLYSERCKFHPSIIERLPLGSKEDNPGGDE